MHTCHWGSQQEQRLESWSYEETMDMSGQDQENHLRVESYDSSRRPSPGLAEGAREGGVLSESGMGWGGGRRVGWKSR